VIGVLFAGGKGERLGSDPVSKPLVPVGGRPLYTYGVDALLSVRCKHIWVIAGDHYDISEDVASRYDRHTVFATVDNPPEPTILASMAAIGTYREDVAMAFGDEWYDLEAVRAFRGRWNGIAAAMLFFVRGEETARKTYTAITSNGYAGMPRIHRLIEKPTWVPAERPYGAIAGTGLAIVRKEIANACAELREHPNWVDLFQVGAVDRGLPTFAVPYDAAYFNVNTPDDLSELREYVTRK